MNLKAAERPGEKLAPRRTAGAPRAMGQGLPPAGWPNRQLSRRVGSSTMNWHLQQGGTGPRCLLIHGTGASTHSWAGLLPLLMEHYECLALDLPGHGFSDAMQQSAPSLSKMADVLAELLRQEQFEPEVIIGHSAGAALALRLVLDGAVAPQVVIGLNAALLPYGGWLAPLAQPLARAFSALAPVQGMLASRARRPGTVERLIASTGSQLEPQAIEHYRQLLTREGHVEATLKMMANWDLRPLLAELPRLKVPVCLVVGEDDLTVPPEQASKVLEALPKARVIRLPGLGHLAHEEQPRATLAAITDGVKWSIKA